MLRRLLLTTNIELYECKESLYSEVLYYLLFLDYRRPSRYEDFSKIIGYDRDDFSSRKNFIKAVVLYGKELSDAEKEESYEIASGFLEDKDDCDWLLEYVYIDFNEISSISSDSSMIISTLNPILKRIHYPNTLHDINLGSFNNLTQS